MVKPADDSIFGKLDNLESVTIEACSRGVKLSKITTKFNGTLDITPLLGKFQQLGFVKIVYNPHTDNEPLIQLTEKGRQEIIELLVSIDLQLR
jgi:hypothetical protein